MSEWVARQWDHASLDAVIWRHQPAGRKVYFEAMAGSNLRNGVRSGEFKTLEEAKAWCEQQLAERDQ